MSADGQNFPARPTTLDRRRLLALATAALASGPAGASTYALAPRKLAEGVWVLSGRQEAITRANGGAIANSVIFDSRDGAIVVDTGPSRRFGEALAALARELTGKPVVRAYLTHMHPDHALGNQAFTPAALAAPAGVIAGLKANAAGYADALYRLAGDAMRGTEPVIPATVVKDGVEEFGGRRLRLTVLSGHTAADLVIFDEASGLLVAGDVTFLDRAPTTPDADLAQWRRSLDRLAAVEHARLIPGHGPVEPGARAIAQTRDWLDAIEQMIRDAFTQGLDMGETMALPLPPALQGLALARYEYERSVMHLLPKLEAGLPRVDERN